MLSPDVKRLKTLWVEDDFDIIEGNIFSFKRDIDPNVEVESNGNLAFNKIKNNDYPFYLIDLDLNCSINGLDLIKEIKIRNTTVPITIVTAKSNSQKFINGIRQIEEKFNCTIPVWKKPLPFYQEDSNLPNILKYNSDKERYLKLTQNPFELSLDQFYSLSFEEMKLANRTASRIIQEKIELIFENEKINWFCVGKEGRHLVIFQYEDKERVLDDSFISLLLENKNAPLFFFKKPKFIEDISSSKWSEIDLINNDYYPTLNLRKDELILECHFDTGSPYNFISAEALTHLLKNKKFLAQTEDKIHGREYQFYDCSETFFYLNENGSKTNLQVNFEAVIDWLQSPLCLKYKDRKGLIGRKILLDNKILIVLDGINKITELKKKIK